MRVQGTSVARYFPYWEVVERADGQFVVVDTSLAVPLQVYGPGLEADMRLWAANTAKLFLSLHGDYQDTLEWEV